MERVGKIGEMGKIGKIGEIELSQSFQFTISPIINLFISLKTKTLHRLTEGSVFHTVLISVGNYF